MLGFLHPLQGLLGRVVMLSGEGTPWEHGRWRSSGSIEGFGAKDTQSVYAVP